MNTIFYFEWKRKKIIIFSHILWPAVLSLILFTICLLIDRLFPSFNADYMNWPAPFMDFFCLRGWNKNLWYNVWQIFILVYSFVLPYTIMSELARAIAEEEHFETIIYLHNAGITKKDILTAKFLLWLGDALACCIILTIIQILITVVSSNTIAAYSGSLGNIGTFYKSLLLSCIFYLPISALIAVHSKQAGMNGSGILELLLFPMLISKLPPLLLVFAELMAQAEMDKAIIGNFTTLGNKLHFLTNICPLTWCWPTMAVHGLYIVCALLCAITIGVGAFAIYDKKRK